MNRTMKNWRDEIASGRLSLAEMSARLEQMRQLLDEPESSYETYRQIDALGTEIRKAVLAIIVDDTLKPQWGVAHTILLESNRIVDAAIRLVKRLYAQQVMAERRASRRKVKQ